MYRYSIIRAKMPLFFLAGVLLVLRAGPLYMQAPAAPAKTSVPGLPTASDAADFESDPRAFCASRLKKHGTAFVTAARGGATFIGDNAALAAIGTSAVAAPVPPELAPPFATLPAGDADPFAAHAEAFNSVCYATIFEWIPQYKEAGFSTFRFEDFIDGRVRKLRASVRSLMLRATAPYTLGVSADRLASTLGFASDKAGNAALDKAYAAYVSSRLGASSTKSGPFGLPSLGGSSLLGGLGGGEIAKFEQGMNQWASSQGIESASALRQLASSVEQTTALLCNLLAATQLHPKAAAALAIEQAAVLKGKDPKLPISTAELEAMPLLNSFVRETMRVYPPCRPAARVLKADLAVGAVKLPAGTLIAPEPFVAHFDPECFAEPLSFDPTRFGAPGAPAPLLLPFASAPTDALGGAAAAPAGERLAISAAKAAYVQLRRMFDQVQLGAEPSPVPSGYPLHTIDERVEALLKPKMYYELQRGVKKLRF